MKKVLIKIRKSVSNVLSKVTECIIPILPVLIGAGMIQVLLIILGPLVLNILQEDSNTYIVLDFVADAGYYFLPVYTAVSSADAFKTNKYVAALVGAMLLSPTYVDLVAKGETLSILGLPIVSTDYSSQIISSIILIWIMSYIFNFLDSHIDKNFKPILAPLFTIIIMIPIAFCAVGPLGVFLGNYLVKLIMILKNLGPVGNGIMCAIIPFITILGLGGANISACLLLVSSGCDPILFFSNILYNNILGAIALAIYLKDEKPETLAAAITSAIAGISEPALFGAAIKRPTAIIALIIGGFCGGFYAGLTGVKTYALASFGTFGLITTIGPDSSILNATIALAIGCIVGFIITFLSDSKKRKRA